MKIRGGSGTSPWQWQQRPSPAQPAVVVGPGTFLQQQQRNPSAQVLPVLKQISSGATIFTKKLPSHHKGIKTSTCGHVTERILIRAGQRRTPSPETSGCFTSEDVRGGADLLEAQPTVGGQQGLQLLGSGHVLADLWGGLTVTSAPPTPTHQLLIQQGGSGVVGGEGEGQGESRLTFSLRASFRCRSVSSAGAARRKVWAHFASWMSLIGWGCLVLLQ